MLIIHSTLLLCPCTGEYTIHVKAPRSLDSTTCTKLNLSGEYQTSRESLVLLEMTQSLLWCKVLIANMSVGAGDLSAGLSCQNLGKNMGKKR